MARPNLDPTAGAGRAPLLSARVPGALRDALAAEAERRGLPVSVAVREAIALWLDAADTEAA